MLLSHTSSVRERGATYRAGAHGSRSQRKSVRELLDEMAEKVSTVGDLLEALAELLGQTTPDGPHPTLAASR